MDRKAIPSIASVVADAEDAWPSASASVDPSASPSLVPSAGPSAVPSASASASTPRVEQTPTPRGNDLDFVINGEDGVSDCIVTVPTTCTSTTTAGVKAAPTAS